jgi:hypothetical protein
VVVSAVNPRITVCSHWRRERTHKAPVLEGKTPLQRVEWQVAARALGVVVWAGHLRARRLEAAAGDEGWGRGGAEGSTGEHLGGWESAARAIGRGAQRTLAVLVEWRGVVGVCMKLAGVQMSGRTTVSDARCQGAGMWWCTDHTFFCSRQHLLDSRLVVLTLSSTTTTNPDRRPEQQSQQR